MGNVVHFFRDTLTIDAALIGALGARSADVIVIGGRKVTLAGLLSGFNYVIAADELIVVPDAGTKLSDTPGVTVMATDIKGALTIECAGSAGQNGEPGEPGESGFIDDDPRNALPGGAGGNGGPGGDGAPGGNITIRFATAATTPRGSAPGGRGGRGGPGGAGGRGKPRGRAGRPGKPGRPGAAGAVRIEQVAAEEVLKLENVSDAAKAWAAYRAEVAEYHFRRFDPASQLEALDEVRAALLLNPQDPLALSVQDRINNRQIPSGLARDIDIALDFPGLAAQLNDQAQIVNDAFNAVAQVTTLSELKEALRVNLGVMRRQMLDRVLEAEGDVALARQDIEIAKAEKANFDAQIDDVRRQIEELRDRSFSLGGLISDAVAIGAAVAGIATGVGAIISVAGGLAALQRVAEGKTLPILLGELIDPLKDPKKITLREQDIIKAKKLGTGIEGLMKGQAAIFSFITAFEELDGAAKKAGQSESGKLLKQQANLTRLKMIAALRENQARLRVALAERRVENLEQDIADVESKLATLTEDAAVLNRAADTLIRSARQIADIVMENVFLAQRAQEVYQLEDIRGLSFDYGFLHPDVDRELSPALRAAECLVSLRGLSTTVLTLNQLFQQLNTAQIGFDVVRPQVSLTITDAAQLQAFAAGSTLSFTIGLEALPQQVFELKVNAMSIELRDASARQSSNIFITHAGDWQMKRRTDGTDVRITLRPRSEFFGVAAGLGTLRASIPARPQPSSEGGPPFSFWGRGVAAEFQLRIAPPSVMDLSALSSIHITVDCLGYAVQGEGGAVRQRSLALAPNVSVSAAVPVAALRAAAKG